MQQLEDRTTPAGLVKDIAAATASAAPADLTAVGNTLFFTADDGTTGIELWKSDGTSGGTQLVKDIRPGSIGSGPTNLTQSGTALFFTANDAVHGRELWVSTDGTAANTYMVTDVYAGAIGSAPADLTVMGSYLYFSADDPTGGRELWRTDGTVINTTRVADIRTGPLGSDPQDLTVMNGKLYFTADDGTSGRELWVYNPGTSTTSLVVDARSGAVESDPLELTAVGTKLYFTADDGTNGRELWMYDGTTAPTGPLKNIDTIPGEGSYPTHLTAVGSTLYFSAYTPTAGEELWKSDGTLGGTTQVANLNPGLGDSNPADLTALGGTLYFTADDGTSGRELWKYTGSGSPTLVKDIATGAGGSSPSSLIASYDTVYFLANDGVNGSQLWKSDGTLLGTTVVSAPGTSTVPAQELAVLANGNVFFAATDATYGTELWGLLLVPFADDFNRANAGDLGSNWVTQTGTVTVTSNAAQGGATPSLATIAAVSQLDSVTQGTVTVSTGVNGSALLAARFSGTGAAPTNYLGGLGSNGGTITAQIYRQVGGATTLLTQSVAITPASSYLIRFEVVNDSLKLFVNGTLRAFAYDATITAAGKSGIRLTTGNTLDDFSAADVALTPVPLPAVGSATTPDTFTQANGTQLSRSWRDRAGNLYVDTNVLKGQGSLNIATLNIPAATAGQGAQVDVGLTASGQSAGIVLRYSGTSAAADTNMYWGSLSYVSATQQQAAIWRNVGGSWTQLAAINLSGLGGVLRFEALGASLKLFVGGARVLTAYDTSLAAGVVGLRSNFGPVMDNFSAFALGATATLPFTDPFNVGGLNQLGSAWREQAGAFDLAAGTAKATGSSGNTATLSGVNAADVAVTGVFKTPSGIEAATGLVARYSGTGEQNFYWGVLNPFGGGTPGYSAQIWKVVGGAGTLLNANSTPLSGASLANAALRFEAFGSSLKLYINDQLASYATDTSLTTGSVGIRSVANAQLDDFTASVFPQQAATLPFADSFASNPPRNTLSGNWQERSGYFQILSGVAKGQESTQANVATLNAVNVANVTIDGTFFFTAAGQTAQLVGRYAGATGTGTGDDNLYFAALDTQANGDAHVRIVKRVNGVATQLGGTVTLAGYFNPANFAAKNPVCQFVLNGTTLTVFVDGVQRLSVTDGTFASGSVGIRTSQGVGVDTFAAT